MSKGTAEEVKPSAKPELTKLEIEEMKTWFNLFDKDGDKKLDKNELMKVFQAKCWDVPEKDFDALFKKADKDGNAHLEYNEYVAMLESFRKDVYEEKMDMQKVLRSKSDCPRKETVAKRHILEYLSDYEVQNLDELMKKADKDGNGKIDIKEFVDLLLD